MSLALVAASILHIIVATPVDESQPAPLPSMVLLSLRGAGVQTDAERTSLNETLLEECKRLQRFTVVPIAELLSTLDFEQTLLAEQCDDVTCAVTLGNLLHSDYVVSSAISVVDGKRLLTLKLFDVRAAKLLVHAVADSAIDARADHELVTGAAEQLRPPKHTSEQAHDGSQPETTTEVAKEPAAGVTIDFGQVGDLSTHEPLSIPDIGSAPPPATESPAVAENADQGEVVVDSVPTGALLHVDGTPVGTTPQTLKLAPGGHQISARLESHIDATQLVSISKGARQEMTLSLAYRYPGRLRVTNAPPEAEITVDGEIAGTMPKTGGSLDLSLASGTHEVRASRQGFIDATEAVYVSAGEALTMNLRLRPVPPPYKRYVWIGLGGGAAALGIGALAAYKAKSAADDYRHGDYGAATTSRRWAGVMYVGTVVGIGLEVATTLLWQRMRAEPTPVAPTPPAPQQSSTGADEPSEAKP